MKSFKNFTDLHEKAKKDVYANPDWKGQSGLEALGSVVKNTLTGRGAAGIKDDDRKARERAAKNYSGQSGLQGITSVIKNTLTGRGAAGIRQDAEEHRRRNDPSYNPKSNKKPKTDTKPKTNDTGSFFDGAKGGKHDTEPQKVVWNGKNWVPNPKAKPPGGGDTPPKAKPPGGGSTPPKAKPQKPSAKDDPRNAQYNKMRKDLNATTFQSKKDKDGATKATEKVGKKAWADANPAAVAAEKKRKASKNPLMKGFGDRDARKKELERIRGGAALKSIGSSKNADKILSGRSASKDAESIAKKSYNRVLTGDPKKGLDKPKTDAPKADAPEAKAPKAKAPAPKAPEAKAPETKTPKAPETKSSGRIGGGTPGDGYLGNPKYGVKNPMPAIKKATGNLLGGPRNQSASPAPAPAPKSSINVDLKNKSGSANLGGNQIDVKFSKGGEKKKYKKESVKSFSDFIEEQKKTKIKLNPKKDDLLEGGYSKGGEICSKCDGEGCNHCDNTGKHSKVKKEDYAYVSQEEVSEEGYQEGYETETDLTEASFEIGPGHRGAMKGKKIYDKGKSTTNPHEKDAFMKRTGPQLPLAKGKKSLDTASYEPETEGEQLDEFLGGMIKNMGGTLGKVAKQGIKPGGGNPLGIKNAATSAGGGLTYTNNSMLLQRAPAQYIRGAVPEPPKNANANAAVKPAGPKPNPIQANRPGFDGKGIANQKPNAAASAGSGAAQKLRNAMNKKPLAASRQLMSFGKFRNLTEGREEDAKKSLDAVKKRQGVLDDYEKKTGKKLDIAKTPEYKSHKQNFPGAKRTGKKKRGEKESELETHNRRVNKYSERLRKYGKTKKQKEYDDGMAKHTSRFD